MRFIDEARITVIAGHGGPGCVSFRRETFVPRGGPDGGDGGDGGDITFIASEQLGTLQDLRFKREYKAPSGMHGQGANKAGKDGTNIEVRVPVGTVIKDQETGEVLIDLSEDGMTWLACEGGRGGKGNAHFVSSTFQAPKFAQPGEEGSTRALKLELKLIADAAIVGFPNAGKSTLISAISAARPKVADYPFTTLTPNLGVVGLEGYRSFVVADVPGLIEGAHEGAGLGHRFLKHVERTRVIIHLLDGATLLELATRPQVGAQGEIHALDRAASIQAAVESILEQYRAIRTELGRFSEALLHKPEIVVLNKLDVLESDAELIEALRKVLRQNIASIRGTAPENGEPWVVSAATGRGLPELLEEMWRQIQAVGAAPGQSLRRPRAEGDVAPLRTRAVLPDDPSIRMKTRKSGT